MTTRRAFLKGVGAFAIAPVVGLHPLPDIPVSQLPWELEKPLIDAPCAGQIRLCECKLCTALPAELYAIINLANPSQESDAVTKAYVDAAMIVRW